MASPTPWLLVAALTLVTTTTAGPLPSNVTNADVGLKEGCALGDVVYAAGEQFPGAGPCERCTCAAGGVTCVRRRCDPRPGCKALHRPDLCCPIYQCECEQEGRVYSNGEKLVDPLDPCRVCYCQGGEVVCRRIACFVRDDCRPRLVPGRCCPEYDNCPLRGVTAIPGMTPSVASVSTLEDLKSSEVPVILKENVKQEITIKEITPVSEIPVITEVKIKEILPSPSVEVSEYPSSKSPLIPREATSESPSNEIIISNADPYIVQEFHSSPSTHDLTTKSSESFMNKKSSDDATPSRISLSTQDSINSDIYPSVSSVATTRVPTVVIPDVVIVVSSTKTPIIEEEDLSLDHNPAFPPIPDDLSVFSNHENENVPETITDSDHLLSGHEDISVASKIPAEPQTTQVTLTKTTKDISEALPLSTERVLESSTGENTLKSETTELLEKKESPMLNLRSAIPTEILNVPSTVPEDITGDLDEAVDTTISANEPVSDVSTLPSTEVKSNDNNQGITLGYISTSDTKTESAVPGLTEIKETTFESQNAHEQTTSQPTVTISNIVTEANSKMDLTLSTVNSENQEKTVDTVTDKADSTTVNPLDLSEMSTKIFSPEVITVSRKAPSNLDNQSIENAETTEFLITYGSSESATDAVELIKISAEPEQNAAIIEPVSDSKNNVLTDLINLVGDVASISDHTEHPRHTAISESEELIPVNAGYKSKNNNWNVNSITEIPTKSKNQTPGGKQKIVEIEDDEAESITDHAPPNDKMEPTTRRPIIDNVSDDMPENKTEKKDIEIITQSYVPTISRRPTKVVMKKIIEKPASEEIPTEAETLTASAESTTDTPASLSAEGASTPEVASVDGSTLSEDTPSAEESDSTEKSSTSVSSATEQ